MHKGDFDPAAIIYGKFTTYRPSTGAAFALASGVLSVYKDDSTTQSTAGVTLSADFDGVAGLNHFAIDTSADGTFYSAGSFFDVVITVGTVDSVSVVGAVVASFTLRKDSSLKPTVAARTLDVSAGGEAGIDWANVGSPTTAVNLSGTNIDTDQIVASVTGAVGSVTGAVGSVTGNVGGNVVGSVASVTAAVTVTGDLSATMKVSVNTEVDTAIADAALATAANLATVDTVVDAILVDTNELQTDWVNGGRLDLILDARASQTSVDDVPTNAELATALGTADDAVLVQVALVKAKTDLIPAAPAAVGDIPTATQNADALLNRDMAAVSVTNTRSPINALRFIRNGFSIAGATLTVLQEDDATPAYTRDLTTDAAAEPITGVS